MKRAKMRFFPNPSRVCCSLPMLVAILTLFFTLSEVLPGLGQPTTKNSSADSVRSAITAREILKGETPEDKERAVRKHKFIDEVAARSHLTPEGDLIFEVLPDSTPDFSLQPEELQELVPLTGDPLEDELRRRFTDIPPTVSVNQVLQSLVESIKSSRKKAPLTDLPIPTNLEIDALKVLWDRTVASPSEVYAELDPAWPGTSEDLHKILASMVEKGLVARRKISASHEFGLFGLAKIELSSKNRKNQVHLYWPIVPKERLIRYLDARRYLAYSAYQTEIANGHTGQMHKALEDKLLRLMQ